jgi:hypothetical protein
MKATAAMVASIGALATLGVLVAFVVVPPASAHSDPCHSRHSCPSDHHTYVWVDPLTGRGLDCARPGADEYNQTRDTTTINWLGLPYNCRLAESAPPAPTQGLVLPIKSVTPGALNAKVRQSTLHRTICTAGWTATVRPSSSYTTTLKIKQLPLYEEGGAASQYEEDHLIPLELGGAPRNPRNLWPEPRAQARRSDTLETKLKRQVCRHTLTLAAARAAILEFKLTHG